jgi:putative flippase GtrA
MALPAPGLYSRVRTLLPELLKFGIVGGIGTVVDLGGAALLHGKYHVEPLAAKAVSTSLATVITYLGSRFWTFKHRENQELKREAVLFIVLNLVGLAIAEVVVGLVTYGLSLHGQLEYNAASFVGTGFGTIFRYFAYRKWVFLAPGEQADAKTAAVPRVPDYPPWEMDPAFFAPAAAQRPAAPSTPPAPPAHLSPWGQEPLSARPRPPAPSWNQAAAAPVWGERGAAPAATRHAAAPVWGERAAAPAAQRLARPVPAAPARQRPSGRHRKS